MERREQLQALAGRFPLMRPWEDFATRYVPPPRGVGDDIAASLCVEPTSTHVIIGAIGSGKSSELQEVARSVARDDPERVLAFADADLLGGGLEHAGVGTLVRKVVEALAQELLRPEQRVAEAGRQTARRVDARAQREARGDRDVIDPVHTRDADDLRMLVDAITPRSVLVVLDSFDRLLPASRYAAAIERDLGVIRASGVGLVLTAPVDMLFHAWREKLNLFSAEHLLAAYDPSSAEHRTFLGHVLARRDSLSLFTSSVRDALLEASGGHLRHLIRCAQRAPLLALRRGAFAVSPQDVASAREELRTFLVSALNGDDIAALEAIASGDMPATASDTLIGLIRTARVFDDGMGRYRVHPPVVVPREGRRVP